MPNIKNWSNKKHEFEYLKHGKFKWSSTEASSLGMTFTTVKANLFQANLEPKIINFENCLKQWHHRKLTLKGKITVIKNYALPKLVYVLSSLPNPPQETVKRIEKMMYNFLWDGKPEKIKRETLTNDYKNGGLKMIDIDMFIKSLKVSWIKRIVNSEEKGILNKIYLQTLQPFGRKLLFECSFSENDIKTFVQNNPFLNDIFTAWCKYNSKNAILCYRNEIIWNNSLITSDNKTITYTNWLNNGIKFIKDLYDDEGKKFYSFGRLKDLYNLPSGDFLKYFTLLNSIPNTWKSNIALEHIDTPIAPTAISQIIKVKQSNSYVYKNFMKNKQHVEIRSQRKWIEQFGDENLDWKNIYTVSLTSTKDVKLQNFQYKHLMRIIPTNKFLLQCHIEESSLCDFCSAHVQTINHLFWECASIQHYWAEMADFLKEYNIHISFSLKIVTFGITLQMDKPEIQVKNFIIMLGKYFIFRNKCLKTLPTLIHFKSYLTKRLKIEQEIFFMRDKIAQFQRTWDKFIAIIN